MAMPLQLFDTLDYAKKLETAGLPTAQAEAQSKLLADVLGKSVAFPGDLVSLERNIVNKIETTELKIEGRLATVDGRLAVMDNNFSMMKWMIGIVLGLQVTLLVKLFLH